jgi:hypothetical protein
MPSAADLERLQTLTFPNSDPVTGPNGPLIRHWHRS